MSIAAPIQKFTKKPAERFRRRIRYANRIPADLNLATVSVTAEDEEGNDITSAVVYTGSARILEDEQKVEFYAHGGTPGLRATFTVTVNLSDTPVSTVLVDYIVMIVR